MNTPRLLTAAAAIALLAGAAHAQTATTPAPADQAPAAASPVVAKGDLIQTVQASGQFNTFLKAVSAVNLTSVLKTNQNLTLFAPTDAAFAALPAGELDKLMLPENGPLLQKVLTYHLINAKVDSTKIKGAKGEVKSVEGSPLLLDGSGTTPMVDSATITQTDVMASNGVLHVVDKVLIPKDVPGLQAAASATDTGATMNVAANEQTAPAAPADQTTPSAQTAATAAPAQASDMAADPAATPQASSATSAAVNTSGTVPVSSKSPDEQASLKAGDADVVSNGPVPDTRENRAKYGGPMSNGGRRTAPRGN